MSFKFGVPEKRKLFGERRKEWSVYYNFLKKLFEHEIFFDEARFSRFIDSRKILQHFGQ